MLKSFLAEYGKEISYLIFPILIILKSGGVIDVDVYDAMTVALFGITGFTVAAAKSTDPAHKLSGG